MALLVVENLNHGRSLSEMPHHNLNTSHVLARLIIQWRTQNKTETEEQEEALMQAHGVCMIMIEGSYAESQSEVVSGIEMKIPVSRK